MDKALTAYSAGDLAAAQVLLNDVAPLNTPLTQASFDYWQCFLSTTQQFLDSTITEMEYLAQIETCRQPRTAGRGQTMQAADDYFAEQIAKRTARQTAKQAKIDALARLQLAPNPTTGAVTVSLADAPSGLVTLTLRDLTGQTVRRWQRTAAADKASAWALDLADVAPGVYLMEVSTTSRTETRRLIVGAGGSASRP